MNKTSSIATPAVRTLSRRGAALVSHPPTAEYIGAHFACVDNAWHPVDNPHGYVAMCIAENTLMGDLLLPKLAPSAPPPPRVLAYDAMTGSLGFRERLASFMGRTFLGREFAPEQIAVLAGAGTVLETLFYTIADPGDAVLVPTPSYSGFWADLETRNGLEIVPVPRDSADGFRLTQGVLDEAMAASERPVRALLFTNPDNPLGRVATIDDMSAVLEWADHHDVHVVFDEIYALSVFGATPFTSVAALRRNLGERIHIVWAFSKDLGASGLRCGVLVSENEGVVAAVDALAYWGAVSGHTQWLLGEAISDGAWVDRYRMELRRRLGEAYSRVSETLDAAGIAHMTAEAGIFVLCDLRDAMREQSARGEQELWRRMLHEANVNLTPGAACRISEPGFFRLCYAAQPTNAIVAGITRLAHVLR